MMLFRPIEIDFACCHALEGALHSDCTDVDVGEDQSDEQYSYHRVDDLCELHLRDFGPVKRHQQQESGYRYCDTRAHGEPVNKLFAQVEAAGRRMLAFNETAPLLE